MGANDNLKRVTLWYRVDREEDTGKIQRYIYNHLEYGWVRGSHPKPLFKTQSGWANGDWERRMAYMSADNVILPRMTK
jgi:hypothetical protein